MKVMQTWSAFCSVIFLSIEMSYTHHFNVFRQSETLLVPLKSLKGANCECGKLTKKVEDERLAKVKVAGGKVPWLAELVTSGDPSYNYEPDKYRLCFGTVVSLQSVLFPASCIQSDFVHAATKPQVKLLGITDRKQQIREILSVRIHPGYRRKFDNDLALVKLKKMIDFNETKIVPICLPKARRKYPKLKPNKAHTNEWDDYDDVDGFVKLAWDDHKKVAPCKNPKPPCKSRPCPPCSQNGKAVKKPYVLDNSVLRTWFYQKAPGYDYIQYYGRFTVEKNVNGSRCHSLFPELLESKILCVQQQENKNIAKQNQRFFKQLELGMPMMLSNTTTVKGKPQPATRKFYLEAMRAPGISGIPLLESRNNVLAMQRIEDYVQWIRENSQPSHFCKL